MNGSFEYTTTLEYRLKAANAQIRAFKSGEIYVRMQEEYLKELRSLEREIRKLKDELSRAHSETVSVRSQWFEIFEELQKECERKLSALRKELERMEKRAIKAEGQRDAALDKVTQQRQKIYGLETALEEEKGRNLKLRAQINRDYENSSIPSSKTLRRKKISNGRERSGRKPGAQPGHPGHGRKKQIPTTEPVLLLPPQEVLEDPDFKKTQRDDLFSMETGLLRQKGRVHFHLGKCINEEFTELAEAGRAEVLHKACKAIDRSIHGGYHLYPINYIAYDELYGTSHYDVNYTQADVDAFNEYIDGQLSKVDVTDVTYEERAFMRTSMLQMYANPLKNKLAALDSSQTL